MSKLLSSSLIILLFILISLVGNDPFFAITSVIFLSILVFLSLAKLLHPIFYYLIPILVAIFVLGNVFELYEQPTIFDKLVHLYGSFVITTLTGLLIKKLFNINKTNLFLILIILFIALLVGIAWEIFEFILGNILKENLLESVEDVITDIISNTLGALLGVWFLTKIKK